MRLSVRGCIVWLVSDQYVGCCNVVVRMCCSRGQATKAKKAGDIQLWKMSVATQLLCIPAMSDSSPIILVICLVSESNHSGDLSDDALVQVPSV